MGGGEGGVIVGGDNRGGGDVAMTCAAGVFKVFTSIISSLVFLARLEKDCALLPSTGEDSGEGGGENDMVDADELSGDNCGMGDSGELGKVMGDCGVLSRVGGVSGRISFCSKYYE